MRKPNLKIVAVAVVIFSLPLLWSVRLGYLRQQSALKANTVSLLALKARATARLVQETLLAQYVVPVIVNSKQFGSADLKGKAAILEALRRRRPDVYLQFSIIKDDGRELARLGGLPGAATDYAANEFFRQAVKNSDTFVAVEQQKNLPPVFSAVERLHAGKQTMFLLTKMSLSRLNDIVVIARSGGDAGETGIVDSGGMIIADSRGMSVEKPGTKVPQELYAVMTGGTGGELKYGAKSLLAGAAGIDIVGWHVYELEPYSRPAFFAGGNRRIIALGLMLVLIAALVFDQLVARLLTVTGREPGA